MKTKYKIIKLFLNNKDNNEKTIKEISRKIGSDYRITHTAITRLIDEGVFTSKRMGACVVSKLNRSFFSADIFRAQVDRRDLILQDRNISQLNKDIINNLETSFYILLFEKDVSGIKLIFITNEISIKNKINSIIPYVPLHINSIVLSESDFKNSIISEGNFVILHGIENYYRLIK